MRKINPQQLAVTILDTLNAGPFVRAHLKRDGSSLIFNNKSWDSSTGKVRIVAVGKAAHAMASAALEVIGKENVAGGLVTSAESLLPGMLCLPGGHPLPDENSLTAGEHALSLAASCNEHDLLLCLLSGGGSAMMEAPKEGITLDDQRRCGEAFLQSGMSIGEINTLRGVLSRIKNGGLLQACNASTCFTLVMSDVPEDLPHIVASGPTLRAQATTPSAIVKKYGLQNKLPKNALKLLSHETPPPVQTPTVQHSGKVIADNRDARKAALSILEKSGFKTTLFPRELQGEAQQQGRELARFLSAGRPGQACVAGGETTVTVQGRGKGGRNMELLCGFMLEAQSRLKGEWLAMAFGTDGIDGPTDAAGAYLDHKTWQGDSGQQKEFKEALRRNNTYPLFARLDTLLKTGPSGTNLRDLFVFARWR